MSDDSIRIREGDWVRFRKGGQLVIGVVAYIRVHRYTQEEVIETDIGSTRFDDVMEVRKRENTNE